ncbi:uncharacterized protein LOC118477973 [Aplysia californica]|uniref:Uncharacterized protein LOC118477973 n=1 Tax=Aplysia californica TaxID=6500 RepID=A0ABM1VW70_APLCA|nr:uncharacterized protein LOC118477973 [Aplysia californica]
MSPSSSSSSTAPSSTAEGPRDSDVGTAPSTPTLPTPRPLFKPHELAASPERLSSSVIRPEPQQPRPDRSPLSDHSPGAEFIKREPPPHPAFPPHHEMLTHFAAARAEFLHRDVVPRDYSTRERGVAIDFNRDLRMEFSKAHELMKQEYSKQHEQFSQEAMGSYARQNGVMGSAS